MVTISPRIIGPTCTEAEFHLTFCGPHTESSIYNCYPQLPPFLSPMHILHTLLSLPNCPCYISAFSPWYVTVPGPLTVHGTPNHFQIPDEITRLPKSPPSLPPTPWELTTLLWDLSTLPQLQPHTKLAHKHQTDPCWITLCWIENATGQEPGKLNRS